MCDGEEANCSAVESGRHYLQMVSGVSMPIFHTVPNTLPTKGFLHSWYYSCSHCGSLQELGVLPSTELSCSGSMILRKERADSCLSKFVFYCEKYKGMYDIFFVRPTLSELCHLTIATQRKYFVKSTIPLSS